jgi:hypothetical protein
MRAYSASVEEAVAARSLLKDWLAESFITREQYDCMEPDTACDLRRTNIFLRLVLFLFTLVIVVAAVLLFSVVTRPSQQTAGVFVLIFAALTYAAAEFSVSQFHLYRYGIEEALAVCSVAFLCGGMLPLLSSSTEFLIPSAGIVASLWIWHRFGLPYAFLAAMIFVIWLAPYWTSSHSTQHAIVAAFYAAGLIAVIALRPRDHSIAEALLWLGLYIAINLQLSSADLLERWWRGPVTTTEFSSAFYWTTWVLTWCLPPVILTRGVREKDRFVIAVGAITAFLTLITNKPYLGWQRHTWDPMLLGALLIATALLLRRWLAAAPNGVRHGFTAQRLSAKDKHWMSIGSAALGLVAPQAVTPTPQPTSPNPRFGGGDSGGAGASSDF